MTNHADMIQQLRKVKCSSCLTRSCEMDIDILINECDFSPPASTNPIRSYILSKMPIPLRQKLRSIRDWFFAGGPSENCTRVGDDYLIRFDEYSMYAPSYRWAYATVDRFSLKYEIFFPVDKGDLCVDTGSCIGDITLPMISRTGLNGRVIAVEPMNDNLYFLRKNLEPYSNATVVEKAISNKKGQQTFFLHNTPTGHSLQSHPERKYGNAQVECDTLDGMFAEYDRIDFFKLEVQGYEVSVLKQADAFFTKVNKLLIETHDRYSRERNTYKEVLAILKGKPFHVRFCIQDGTVHCKAISE